MILTVAAVLGLIAVVFGAYAEHVLRDIITDEHFRYLMTAIRYNQIHAVMSAAIGLSLTASSKLENILFLRWSAWLFIIGTMLFSFSIYLSVWLNLPKLVYVTPIGGSIIMLAWAVLTAAGISMFKHAQYK